MEPTLLQYPDLSKEYCIITDASKQACEATKMDSIAYASRHSQNVKVIKALQSQNYQKFTGQHQNFDHIFMENILQSRPTSDP